MTRYQYDAQHQLTQAVVGDGTTQAITTTYTYDTIGRVTDVVVGAGTSLARRTKTVYNSDSTVQLVTENYQNGIFDAHQPDTDLTTTYTYDALGRQIASTDPLGRIDTTAYDRASRVLWTAQHVVPYSIDPITQQPTYVPFAAQTPDANIATRYGYDRLGRTSLITQTGLLTGTFTTNPLRFSSQDERVTRLEYDALNRPITTTLNYRPNSAVDTNPDINVRTISYYDGNGQPIWQRDPLGRWTRTQYDQISRPITVTMNYENGNPTTLNPANTGWATLTDTDRLRVTRYDFPNLYDRVIENYEDGVYSPAAPDRDRITETYHNGGGWPTLTMRNVAPGTAPDTNIQSEITYHPWLGRMAYETDSLHRVTLSSYDVLGRPNVTIQNCSPVGFDGVEYSCPTAAAGDTTTNLRTTTTYDQLGQVATTVDPAGHATLNVYDGVGRVRQTVANYVVNGPSTPDTNVVTSQAYDALGRTTVITDATSQVTRMRYDALGRTTVMTDTAGRVTTMGYDGTGTLRWQAAPGGQLTLVMVDGLGRTTATIANYTSGSSTAPDQDLRTTTAYDQAGRRVRTVDATGRVTTFAYNNADDLIMVTENVMPNGCATLPPAQQPCNVATRYDYDRMGNRTAIIRPLTANSSSVQRLSYDALDRLRTSTDALGRVTEQVYDTGGRMVAQIDPRGADYSRTFRYDTLDRQIGITTTNALTLAPISMTYDRLGRRTTLTDGTGTTTFTPDALGRITQVQAPVTGSVGYGYNARGERTRLTYPNGGPVIDYTYKPDGQLAQVLQSGTALATYQYDTAGRLQQLQRANGATTTYGYDGADRVKDILTSVGGSTVSQFTYTLDKLGLRTQVQETLPDLSSPTPSPTVTGTPPTATRTATSPPATATGTPPTATRTATSPPATATGATSTATRTATGATSTATATSAPATATRTATSAPATATATSAPATATATSAPATATGTATRTATPVGPTPTATRTPTASATTSPTASLTPSATATTAPSATPTSTGSGSLYYAVDMSVGAYLEAETFTAKVGPLLHAFSDASRSNGAGMETTDNGATIANATGSTDYLTYDLHVTTGGTVNVYLLSTGPNANSDSVWLGVDGTDQQVITGSSGTWTWKKPSATFSLPTGNHTLTIKNREDGAQVDKIYLTTGSTAPTGLGGTALTPQYGSVVTGWLAAYHPSQASDTVQGTTALDGDGTARLGLSAVHAAVAPQSHALTVGAATTSRTLTYQYDGLQRLIGATASGAATATYSYTYDLGGNRTSATVNGVTTTRTYNAANQVVGWTYDTVGNLTNDGTTTYGYDALNRQITTGGTTNSYNGDGTLVQQGTTRYTQDLIAPLSQILSDGTQTYVYGHERLYSQTGTVKTWYATDALGSVRYTMNNVSESNSPQRTQRLCAFVVNSA